MIIIKCDKCGALMHKANRCFSCGNTTGFIEMDIPVVIHDNVKEEYEKLERFVKSGKFEEALSLSKTLLEWMPFCSDIFWQRFLAKNRCSSDEALIRKGVSCADSAEYYNAVLYANDLQKKVYLNIEAKISAVQNVLFQHLIDQEYYEKTLISIFQMQKLFSVKVESYKKKLFQLWDSMNEIEYKMFVLEKACTLYIQEHKLVLERTSRIASEMEHKINNYMSKCTLKEQYWYRNMFETLRYHSEQANDSIKLTSLEKQYPWLNDYQALVAKRDAINMEINSEINSFKSDMRCVSSMIEDLEKIEKKHKEALSSTARYQFSDALHLLGEERFESALIEAGIR